MKEGAANHQSQRRRSFSRVLEESSFEEYAEEATLKERAMMFSLTCLLVTGMVVSLAVVLQLFVGEVVNASLSTPLTIEEAQARTLVVLLSCLTVASITVFSACVSLKTPLGCMLCGAKVVDSHSLQEISLTKSMLRAILKIVISIAPPLAIFYIIKSRDGSLVDQALGTRIVLFRKSLSHD